MYDFSAFSGKMYTVKTTGVNTRNFNYNFCGVAPAVDQCQTDNASMCITTAQDKYYLSAAIWQTQADIHDIVADDAGVRLVFTNGVDSIFTNIRTEVYVKCADAAGTPSVPDGTGFSPYLTVFTVEHPSGCKGAAGTGSGLSGGSIFLIIIALAVTLYIVVGCAVNVKKHGAAVGREACPQRAFWVAFWGLVCAGVAFTKNGCKKGRGAGAGNSTSYGAQDDTNQDSQFSQL